MNKGFYRLGLVISVLWVILICSFALYEWQAPFYKKTIFFFVAPQPETIGVDSAISVTTLFLLERFFSVIFLPLIGLWFLLLARPAMTWVRNGFKL